MRSSPSAARSSPRACWPDWAGASLGVTAGLDPRIGPFVALYVLVLAVLGPLLASRSQRLAHALPAGAFHPR